MSAPSSGQLPLALGGLLPSPGGLLPGGLGGYSEEEEEAPVTRGLWRRVTRREGAKKVIC